MELINSLLIFNESIENAIVKINFLNNNYSLNFETLNYLIVSIFLILFAFYLSFEIKRSDPEKKAKGILKYSYFWIKSLNQMFDSFAGENKLNAKDKSFLFSMLIIIIFSNIMPIIGFVPPFSSYTITIAITVISFIYVFYTSLKEFRFNIFKYILAWAPNIYLLPIEIISRLSWILSISFRLFGNILAGYVIIEVLIKSMNSLAGLIGWSVLLIPVKLVFEIADPLLQSFVYVILLSVYIGQLKTKH